MKTVPSTEFRKTYSEIDEPVVVTANGHVIGWWTPVQIEGQLQVVIPERPHDTFGRSYPVPKPGKKR